MCDQRRLVQLAELDKPPLRFVARTDPMQHAEAKADALRAQIDSPRAF